MDQLAMVEARNPGELLLPTLRTGHSRVNEAYLRAAMKRLPDEAAQEPEPALWHDTRYADSSLQDLWRDRGRLFGAMNKLSNKFHDCKSDDERAANSREIRRLWAEILTVKDAIAHYEQHGALPAPVSEERFPLPDDPVALVKKQASIRAVISQTKRKLDELGALADGDPERAKIVDYEAKLAELKLYLGHADTAIKRASIHAI